MSETTQPAVVGPTKSTVGHCWPTPWLEAAMRAGFAHYKGGGEWVFLNDKMRDMLADFASYLQSESSIYQERKPQDEQY